jgi:RNA polymerase sigma-70 factor (ECF subfamily)
VEGRPPEEAELVARARRGDLLAFERLVTRHQPLAFRTACLLAGDPGDAEEAVQDAFLKAYRALGRFRDGAPFRPWLLRIVRHEALNRRARSGRRGALVLRVAQDGPSGDAAPSPEAALLAAEQRAALLAALGRLREADRLVLACRYFLDLGEEETAAVLDCARGTVKSRLARALDRLRALEAVDA